MSTLHPKTAPHLTPHWPPSVVALFASFAVLSSVLYSPNRVEAPDVRYRRVEATRREFASLFDELRDE